MRLFLALALLATIPSAAFAQIADAVVYTRGGEVPLKLELATTPEQRRTGLMHRQELAPHDGMLFVFPISGIHSFWMKNTALPLDMLFINEHQTVVHIAEHTTPYATSPYGPDAPVIAVIELDAGRSSRDSIAVGDKVRYVVPDTIEVY